MNRSTPRFVSGWLLVGAVALAASQPTVPPRPDPSPRPVTLSPNETALNAIADLPEFVVSDGKKGPRSLYGEVEGMQILSLCSEAETKAFVRELEVQRFLLEQMLPEGLRAPFSAPLLFILKPRPPVDRSGTVVTSPLAARAAAAGLSITISQTVLRDWDAMAIMRTMPANSGARSSPAGETGAFPVAAILSASPLPAWARSELSLWLGGYRVMQDSLQLSVPFAGVDPAAWPSIDEFFHRDPNPPAGARGQPGAAPGETGPRIARTSALYTAFSAWALLENPARAKAFWTFVRRTTTEPATEALFQECFGLSYAAMQEQVGRNAPLDDGRQRSRMQKIVMAKPPTFPPVAFHPVTKTELTRAKGEWKRLAAGNGQFRSTPAWRQQTLDEVGRELESAYQQGERDPQILAELALAECDAGHDEPARRYLEAAVDTRLARPRIYFELARLRYQAAKQAPEGTGGHFGSKQIADILDPLKVARSLVPVLDDVYLLMADTLAHSASAPTAGELATLDEGVRRYPGLVDFSHRVAELHTRGESSAAGLDDSGAFLTDLVPYGQASRSAQRRVIELQSPPFMTGSSRIAPASIQLPPSSTAGAYHPPTTGDWVFNLLPKSLQLRPLLDMTVATSFTPYGRLIRPATPQDPAYYALKNGGFLQLGESVGGEHSPPAERIEMVLKSSLANNGYLPAAPAGRTPTLLIAYWWGTHNVPSPQPFGMRPNMLELLEDMRQRQLLVTGGLRYPRDWDKQEYLSDQIHNDLYFVVASAYDYSQYVQGIKKMVWRTTMTVSSLGVSMNETLSPLIVSAAPYFGREMNEAELTSRKISRGGHVEIGPLITVPDEDEKKPAVPPPAKP